MKLRFTLTVVLEVDEETNRRLEVGDVSAFEMTEEKFQTLLKAEKVRIEDVNPTK